MSKVVCPATECHADNDGDCGFTDCPLYKPVPAANEHLKRALSSPMSKEPTVEDQLLIDARKFYLPEHALVSAERMENVDGYMYGRVLLTMLDAKQQELDRVKVERFCRHSEMCSECFTAFAERDVLRAELASTRRDFECEIDIVNRVWTSLGVDKFENAKGKSIWDMAKEISVELTNLKQENCALLRRVREQEELRADNQRLTAEVERQRCELAEWQGAREHMVREIEQLKAMLTLQIETTQAWDKKRDGEIERLTSSLRKERKSKDDNLVKAEGEIERLKVGLQSAQYWIFWHSQDWQGDWACVQCKPNSDMLIEGFVCAVHEAKKALGE